MNNKLALIILDKADEDMTAIAAYISKNNKIAAASFLQQLYTAFELLTYYPELGCKRPDLTNKDVKFYVFRKKYLILYALNNNTLSILRIFSTYKDICSLLEP